MAGELHLRCEALGAGDLGNQLRRVSSPHPSSRSSCQELLGRISEITRREHEYEGRATVSPRDGDAEYDRWPALPRNQEEFDLAKAKKVDEEWVRGLFGRFSDREAFFADPEGTWIERPRYRVIAQDLEMNSRDEVVAWFRETFDAVPDLKMEVEDVAIAGEPGRERVTVRWRMTGTFSGAPYLGIEPTGRSIDLRGMDLIDVEEGRVAGNNIYYDQLTFARQIGMLPAEGSRSDRLMTRGFNLATKGRAKLRERSHS